MIITLYDKKGSIASHGKAEVVKDFGGRVRPGSSVGASSSVTNPLKDLLAIVRQRKTWQKGRGSHKSRDGGELRNVHIPHPNLGEAKSGLFPGVPEE